MISRRSLLAVASVALAGCGGGGAGPDTISVAGPLPTASPTPVPPLAFASGEGAWRGFRYFTAGEAGGKPLVVAPVGPTNAADWVGQSTIAALVARGFYVLGAHWPGLDGGENDYGARYPMIGEWLASMKLSRPSLFAQSRGALQLLNFACDNPDAFDKFVALYPVTDPYVFPGAGTELWSAHGTTQEGFDRAKFTPNLKADRLRGRRVKIWHGDLDTLVPKALTTDMFAAASGAEVVTVPGLAHERYFDQAMADFLA